MKILIVENNQKHLEDAMRVVITAGHEVSTVSDATSALRALYEGFDGVITDLFFSCDELYPKQNPVTDPCGVLVALECELLTLPFVICTSEGHHGAHVNWVCQLGRRRGWPEIVDNTRPSDMGKNWGKALEMLTTIINKK